MLVIKIVSVLLFGFEKGKSSKKRKKINANIESAKT